MLARCASALAAFAVALPVAALEPVSTGFVHVRAVQGVSVRLDGKFQGVIENEEGLIIRDVEPGIHRVHAFLSGHEDQHALVSVEAGAIALAALRPFQPVAEQRGTDEQAPRATTGAMWIEAIARHATIDSKKLGWKKIALDGEPYVATNVPAGQHKVTFCNPEKCIDYRATVKANDVLAVIVDFGMNQIQDVSALRKNQWARWRELCAKSVDRRACKEVCNIDFALDPNASSSSCEALSPKAPAIAAQNEAAVVNVSSVLTPPCEKDPGEHRGFVTLKTTPDSEIFVGDKSIGQTPLSRVPLPAGCVEVRAVSETGEKTLRIEVEPNRVTVYKFDL